MVERSIHPCVPVVVEFGGCHPGRLEPHLACRVLGVDNVCQGSQFHQQALALGGELHLPLFWWLRDVQEELGLGFVRSGANCDVGISHTFCAVLDSSSLFLVAFVVLLVQRNNAAPPPDTRDKDVREVQVQPKGVDEFGHLLVNDFLRFRVWVEIIAGPRARFRSVPAVGPLAQSWWASFDALHLVLYLRDLSPCSLPCLWRCRGSSWWSPLLRLDVLFEGAHPLVRLSHCQ